MDSADDVSTGDEMKHESITISSTHKSTSGKHYQWRMRHYFYIHVFLFILNGLVGGIAVLVIENYLEPNRLMRVRFIDTWFVSASCIFCCGLTTLDFARLSTYSQVILMLFTLSSGITVSTLPALVIKARTHKRESGPKVDDDHSASRRHSTFEKKIPCSPEAESQMSRLPDAEQLRYRAYLSCLGLIPFTCLTIYLSAFACIGGWIRTQYSPGDLRQDGQPVNPWYASFIITVTGFNQNGLTPWSDSLMRFVHDSVFNMLVMLLIISGNSFFPFIFRNVILFARWLVPWHQKVIFDYILLNNHRLSTVLFPTIQTRIYLTVTFLLYTLGIVTSLLLDYRSQSFADYSSANRVLIFAFQTVASRFAGFQTIDMMLFSKGTLIIYLLLMAVKPQMLCALDETPFEVEWQSIRDRQTINIDKKPRRSSSASCSSSIRSHIHPMRHLHRFLRDHSLNARLRAERHFASMATIRYPQQRTQATKWIKLRLFSFLMARRIISHAFVLFTRTQTWLFIFIFLIFAFESYHMTPMDENVTEFKIIFEVLSAFGAAGLSTGYPNLKSSFATVLSTPSKIILILTMLIGRHRGLLQSMKDQEKIEYSAHTLLERWQRFARDEHPIISIPPSSSPSSPPKVKPRNIAVHRPSRLRYVIEPAKPNVPCRTIRVVY